MRIEDYGMIGDCETAALVGSNGSIDWLYLPRFDSGACFAGLLGTEENGYWRLAPLGVDQSSRRKYRANTLILETDFDTPDGAVTVVDFMPLRETHPQLVRTIIGRRGSVRMRMDLVIRFDYGSTTPWVQRIDHSLRAIAGPDALILRSPIETRGEGLRTTAEFTVEAGQEIPFVLTWYRSYEESPAPSDAVALLRTTEQWWIDWSARCAYQGPWREAVLRSLITLRALCFDPTGGIVAAPTTSLPEALGGVRNWDYRFCWIRDATFTLLSLLHSGYVEEASAWRSWLLRAVAGSPEKMQILYSVTGERRLPEMNLKWLCGYAASVPVRIGNGASEQFQLDVYGEVLHLLYQCRRHKVHSGEDSWPFELAILEFLETAWRQPDHSLWEVRGPKRHFTHSKMMAWVGFDRAIKSVDQFGRQGPVDKWRRIRSQIHAEICERGYSQKRRAFIQAYDSDDLDASLLMMPLVGFLPVDDSRVQGTIAAIESNLMHDGFVKRYHTSSNVDGLPPGEGAFLPCTLWLVDALAQSGRDGDARELFDRVLDIRNDLGLISEEYDPVERRLVGNFPQAFTHVGLVAAAFHLLKPESPYS